MQQKTIRNLLTVFGLAVAVLLTLLNEQASQSSASPLSELFQEQRSGVMIEVTGVVDRVLRDDNEGSRHQRFILSADENMTVLVAHNIDLAPRVPLAEGDSVVVYGQYEWNDRGGVLHWTHHDPQGRREGGWIQAGDRKFR